ncbi:MAG: BACON domain-containing protein [Tidjanibacter sp.]|nr:BACON domain-containing protein [Tidjanibacter sp.]MBR7129657.1 BACON domain-containing protein [Tidjanibacter sp.]
MKKILYGVMAAIAAIAMIGCEPNGEESGVEGPKLTVKPEKVTLAAEANAYASVTVTTDATKVVAEPQNDWIKADVMGKSIIVTALSANESTTDVRKGSVKVTAGEAPAQTTVTLNVEQSAKSTASVTVTYSPASLTLLNQIGDSMDVTLNVTGFTVAVPEADQEWLEATKKDAVVTFTIKALNPNPEVRTSQVAFTFSGSVSPAIQTYPVSQAAAVAEPEPTPKDDRIGTAYDKDGVKGVIFWVDPADATKAKIVSTQAYGPQNWCNDGYDALAITTTEDNGKANMEAIAAAAGENIGEFLSYQSCKTEGEGWYLPSRIELENLLKGYYAVDDLTLLRNENCKNPAEMANPELCPVGAAALAARDKFEAALVALGGEKLNQSADDVNDGTTYLSSTVNTANTTQVAYGCTGGPRISNAAKTAKSPKRYTRCIMDVTLPAAE